MPPIEQGVVLASAMQFSDVNVVTRPGMGSMPKEMRDVCNILIDNGWTFVPGKVGRKHKLYPPDRKYRTCTVPVTPSASSNMVVWLSTLRRSGAMLDENGKSLYPERDPRYVRGQSDAELMAAVADKIDPDLSPVTTHGAWWRSPAAQPELPIPAPEPPAEPVQKARRYEGRPLVPRPAQIDADAEGTAFTLGQARSLLRQGYHVNKVIAKTGWGRNWFSDMVDPSGYVAL